MSDLLGRLATNRIEIGLAASLVAMLAYCWFVVPEEMGRRSGLAGGDRNAVVARWRDAIGKAIAFPALLLAAVIPVYRLLDDYRQQVEATHRQVEASFRDQYRAASEAFGSARPELRIGAIFQFERLLVASPENARSVLREVSARVGSLYMRDGHKQSERIAPDAQAALYLLTRREGSLTELPLFLSNGSFRGAFVPCAELAHADLSFTDLSGSELYLAKFFEANLRSADLRGANLTCAELSHAGLVDAHLESGRNLAVPSLMGRDVPVQAGSVTLYSADLTRAHLEGVLLGNAVLDDADLTDAHLESAHMDRAQFHHANLVGTHFAGARARCAKFEANLWPVPALRSRLERTDFRKADLANASFRGAEIVSVRFEGADLTGASFEQAEVKQKDFLKGAHLCRTTMPNGSMRNDACPAGEAPEAHDCEPPSGPCSWPEIQCGSQE